MSDEYIFCECCNCVTSHQVKHQSGLLVHVCRECGAETSEREKQAKHEHRRLEREPRDGRR
jgi:hypothetical protein